MAEENRLTAEQLSTIEKLVKLSIVFTVVTPFVFRILLLALPPLPAEIAAAKLYIVLFMGFVSDGHEYGEIVTQRCSGKSKFAGHSSLCRWLGYKWKEENDEDSRHGRFVVFGNQLLRALTPFH
ncbi:hypothetical protein P8452_44914 [Trifolium repens]|nr:hypothetical protein P8452_44914 [Trifolium repens]